MTLAFSINSKNQVSKAIIFNVETLITERKLQTYRKKESVIPTLVRQELPKKIIGRKELHLQK
jgi:hypothetical protein